MPIIGFGGFIRLACISLLFYGILYLVNPYDPYNDIQEVIVTAKYIPVNYTVSKPKKRVETALECLQKNLYFEAANQGYDGMVAVANVTMNRVHSDEYPHDVCGVIHQILVRNGQRLCQFAWYCQPSKPIFSHSGAWKLAGTIARATLAGKVDNLVQDAKFYHAFYITPAWAEEKELVVQIGDHIFYR